MTWLVIMMKRLESPPSGEELIEIRSVYKMSKRQMGEVLGVSAQIIRSYESGKTPVPLKHLEQLNLLLSTEPPSSPTQLTTEELLRLRALYTPAPNPEGQSGSSKEAEDELPPPEKIPPREILQRINESRTAEREQWLRIADQMKPKEFRKLRISRCLSEKMLGSVMGLSSTAIHSYETGRCRIPKGLVRKVLELCPYRNLTPSEIIELRHALGLKQLDIANGVGLTRNAIGNYEGKKRKINFFVSEKIMKYLTEQVEKTDPDDSN